MRLDLSTFEEDAKNAVANFWRGRNSAREKQTLIGQSDQGNRGAVTAGKNMDGFVNLVQKIALTNGLKSEDIHLTKRVLTLPGFFRPTKSWDVLITRNKKLIAAMEFKSQVGSFGNNFNNRTEEAIGTALDLKTAFREGAFGDQPKPFVGWVMLLEDCEASQKPVSDRSPHFEILKEFKGASYAKRYHLFCKKLMQEELYDSAAFLLSSSELGIEGGFKELDSMTSLRTFVSQLAARLVAELS